MSKIFGVGMSKTGTTTLGHCLDKLGYKHCHGSYRSGNKLASSYLTGNYQELYDHITQYDSFEDLPFCAPPVPYILAEKYPDSKFILTTRDEESWYKSLKAMLNPPKYKGQSILEVSKTNSDQPLGRLYGLVLYMLATFGTLHIEANKDHYIKTYQDYNESIIKLFDDQPDRLLVVSWMRGDKWDKLCKFLNRPIPRHIKFPHLNKGKYRR